MLQNLARNLAVRLFGFAAKLGLNRSRLFNRTFLALYSIYKRYLEAGPIDRLREFVPAGSLVIDVGANVGFFACRFAEWVGETGRVLAIEPEDRNFYNLTSALDRAGLLERVSVFKAVAAAEPGEMLLEINALHPADHKLSRNGEGVAVTAVTLDNMVAANGDQKLALVKIDVQGAEMLVLRGAEKVLKAAMPALFIELDERGLGKFGSSVSAVLEYLASFSYEAYWLKAEGSHSRASPADIHAKVARHGYVDVLFLTANAPPSGQCRS